MTNPIGIAAGFNPTPSVKRSAEVTIGVVRSVPPGTGIIGVPVDLDGAVPGELGFDRATLAASGFDGEVGQTLVLPRRGHVGRRVGEQDNKDRQNKKITAG